MPGVVAVRYTSLGNHLVTFDTLGGKLVFIAFGTIYIVFFRNEGFGAYRLFTGTANKTFFMPLSCLVLHFLHACSEDIATAITSGCELSIIAWSTVDPISFGPKLFVN